MYPLRSLSAAPKPLRLDASSNRAHLPGRLCPASPLLMDDPVADVIKGITEQLLSKIIQKLHMEC